MFLALIVFFVLDSEIVDIELGGLPGKIMKDADGKVVGFDNKTNGFYVVTSFLSGFSERFARDILSRVPIAK